MSIQRILTKFHKNLNCSFHHQNFGTTIRQYPLPKTQAASTYPSQNDNSPSSTQELPNSSNKNFKKSSEWTNKTQNTQKEIDEPLKLYRAP